MSDALNPLDQFLQHAAAHYGDRDVARWVLSGQSLTYRELVAQVRACATGLATIGVGTGSHVAMMLPSCPAGTITWFALARLGAVLTPLNPGYVAEELAYVLDNADAEYLIVDHSLAGLLDTPGVALPALRDVIVHGGDRKDMRPWDSLLTQGDVAAPQAMPENRMFSVQYTSGTTGKPKGCMLTQDYWAHLGARAAEELDGLNIVNTMIWSPFFYMDAQWQLLMSMQIGATAHIVEKMSLSKLPGWLETYRIEYFSFPEPFMQRLDDSERPDWPLKFVNTFTWRSHNIAKLRQLFGAIGRDAFGMTEVGGVTAMPVDADLEKYAGSCGPAAPGCAIRVVDEQDKDLPSGTSGELLVRTPHMLLGYYKNPEATADSYLDGWFRTGDLAAIDDDGFLYIRGRLKEMIKRSGENIAAREVEAVILQHEAVQEVAVVPVPDPLRREEVKAFVILKDGKSPDETQAHAIAAHCSDRLAAFKQPRFIEFTEELPRTATRKVAKHELSRRPAVTPGMGWDRNNWT